MKFFNSFKYAFNGIKSALFSERNFTIQLAIGIFTILLGFLLHINKLEWLFVILCISAVLAFELFNSAVEKICNFICDEYHSKIKVIKDMAAGAVLVLTIASIIIAIIIFLPRIITLIKSFQQ